MTNDSTDAIEIFARVICPENGDLAANAAQAFLAMSFPENDQIRMDELAKKARQGTLTEAEELEIGNYERVGHCLAILQSKARMSLKSLSAQ